MLSIQAVRMAFLACVHLALFLALSLSPGNSLAQIINSKACDVGTVCRRHDEHHRIDSRCRCHFDHADRRVSVRQVRSRIVLCLR